MKVTQIKNKGKALTYSPVELESIVTAIREGVVSQEVAEYRQLLLTVDGDIVPKGNAIPAVCFAAVWRKSGGQLLMKNYNRLVALEISNLPSSEDAVKLRREASRIPYTRLAYVGATGRDVVIVCAMTAEGIEEKTTEKQISGMHLAAYKMLHYLYSSQLLLAVDNKQPRLDSTCLMSFDRDAYYNPVSEPYVVTDEAMEVPLYKGAHEVAEPQLREESVFTIYSIFESCLTNAFEEARLRSDESMTDKDFNLMVLNILAANSNDANVPIDFAVRHTSWKRQFGGDAIYIERVFCNAYEKRMSKMIPYGFVNKNALMVYKTEAFLKMHYELRRNILTGVVQYRSKDGYNYEFRDLTDTVMNTMTNRALKAGIGSWDKDLHRIVNSNDVKEYDPIADYIFSLPKWDGKDRVDDLVRRIPTDCTDVRLYLHTWLLSMVAHWLGRDRQHGNALVPLLIGHQGCGKTTLCGMLLPPALADYYNDKVNFKNETDLNLGLTSFALINIDEFDSVKKSQQAVLKYLLSKSSVTMRPPFGKAYQNRRRYASFIATTNKERPLVDRTGSRRFACIHILPGHSIDTTTPIDYDQLYAQLYHEIFHGTRYWLDDAETKALMLHNMKYRELTDLSEMVDCAFAIPTDDEGEYLTSYELIDYLALQNKDLSRSNNLNVELGKVMRAKGFEYKHRNKGVVYKVKRVNLPYK